MGAAGRDFHNFNTIYRDNKACEVVGFTATQIPNILDRKYPASLAGKLYPEGIPIYDEKVKAEVLEMLRIQLADNVKARIIDEADKNEYKQNDMDLSIRSQVELYYHYKNIIISKSY